MLPPPSTHLPPSTSPPPLPWHRRRRAGAAEVIPGVLILLPATTGGIAKSLHMYAQMASAEVPEALPGVLALSITAAIAGIGKVGGAGRRGAGWGCRSAPKINLC